MQNTPVKSELDTTTRRRMASMFGIEEEHADDLVGLMHGLKD